MFTFTTLLTVATVTFILGCLLSVILLRSLSPSEQKTRNLETRLQQAEETLTDYQQEVTEHFAETARLVNTLTQNYKEVHEHLTSNALKLGNIDISRDLLANSPGDDTSDMTIDEDNFQPPKDWAPGEGTLSEDYGLQSNDDTIADPLHLVEAHQHK